MSVNRREKAAGRPGTRVGREDARRASPRAANQLEAAAIGPPRPARHRRFAEISVNVEARQRPTFTVETRGGQEETGRGHRGPERSAPGGRRPLALGEVAGLFRLLERPVAHCAVKHSAVKHCAVEHSGAAGELPQLLTSR